MHALDPRVPAGVILVWMIILIAMFCQMHIDDSSFFHFGPSEQLLFFRIKINTTARYIAICVYIIVNQSIQTYGLETISPWMINVVENVDAVVLPFSELQSFMVVAVWYVYLWSGRIIGIQLMLSQFDLLLVVLFADITATLFVTKMYFADKQKKQMRACLLITN